MSAKAPCTIHLILIKADLIHATEKLGFPPFSGDGAYLTRHVVGELTGALGQRRDVIAVQNCYVLDPYSVVQLNQFSAAFLEQRTVDRERYGLVSPVTQIEWCLC